MHRLAPTLLLLTACTRYGFVLPDDAAADTPVFDAPVFDVQWDRAPADSAPPDGPRRDSAAPDSASPDAGAQPLAGVLQNAGSGPVFRLLFGMADNNYQDLPPAHIKELQLDASSNSVVDQGYLAASPGSLKALDLDDQGRLLLAHYTTAPIVMDRVAVGPPLKLAGSLPLSHAADPALAMVYPHALCYLPGGNVLIAAGANADNNHFNEYDPAGNLVRGVHTSTLASSGVGSVISVCISRSDLEILAHESAINAYQGRLLRFTRASVTAAWTLTESVEVADIATKVGATTPRTWSFALDQKNDYLYLAPFAPAGNDIKQLIRCPAQGLSATSCVPVGDPLPGANTSGGSTIKGLAQIPGTDDLLAINHGSDTVSAARKIYRYDAKSGAWTVLFDLRQISGGYAQPQGYPLLL